MAQVGHRATFPVSCCAWGDVEKSLLDLAFGLQMSCQGQKYSGEVIATHSRAEQSREMLIVFITGSLLSLLAWGVTWPKATLGNFPGERGGFVNESDISFLQLYPFQEKEMERSYFPEEKVAQSISLAGVFQTCLPPSVSLVELSVRVFQKLVVNFLWWLKYKNS